MITNDEYRSPEEHLSSIIDSVEEGIIAIDTRGVITNFYKPTGAFEELTPSQAIGSHINKIFPEARLLEVLPEGVSFRNRSIDRVLPNGHERFVVSAHPLRESGLITGVVASIRIDDEPERARKSERLTDENDLFEAIVGSSPQLVAAKAKALRVAGSSSSVLIRGESGTGKELFSRAIHQASKRRQENFVSINCAAIPSDLLESELFGYEPGSFTGAQKSGRSGKFEIAHRGTVFLDEIGDMTTELQVKILRVLQDGRFFRIGGLKEAAVDVRVLAATNQNLEELIARGRFREDLFYRLNVIPLYIPPLRERREDIPTLSNHFISKYNVQMQKKIEGLTAEAQTRLMEYNWPGNVRELENVVEHAINMETSSLITNQSLPIGLIGGGEAGTQPTTQNTLQAMMASHEREILKGYLDRYGWTTAGKTTAAQALGIGRTTLYSKLKKLGLL